MTRTLTYSKQPWAEIYSEIIDVRSESEFAEDHIPGAINLPVLNDPQRERVGTLYKQIDPFTARKIGASLVAENLATHLKVHFANKDKNYNPLVYCWRGGQRSHSMALVLSQIGWKVTLLEGGYKTYRAYVREQLVQLPRLLTYRVLCGRTGTGKTHILRQMATENFQVLDLEALANHRGSLLGEAWEVKSGGSVGEETPAQFAPVAQPSQKYFESLLLQQLQSFDPNQPVWVESESNKIGKVYLPESLWEMMKHSSCISIEIPLTPRIQWLLQEYPHLTLYPDILKKKLQRLKSRYGGVKLSQWDCWIDAGEWEALVADLLEFHYDGTYERSLYRSFPQQVHRLTLPDLSAASIRQLIQALKNF